MSDTRRTFDDDLRDLGDLIVGWHRPMSDAELLSYIRQWWIDKGEPHLQSVACSCFEAGRNPECPIHGSYAGRPVT